MRKILRNVFGPFLDRWRWRRIARFLEGDILDIGCGSGGLYTHAKRKGIERYLGVDISASRQKKEFEFLELDIETTAREVIKGSFDRIVLGACIEHLKQPAEVLKWCRAMMRPDGFLVMTTPTPLGQKLLKAVFGGGSEHTVVYDRRELSDLLEAAAFSIATHKLFELGANQLVVAVPRSLAKGE